MIVIADAEQIKRVVNNIVSNSLKYTDSDKPKKINLRVRDVLTWWIYRGVIAPLDKLRMATQKIKSGDLDFSVASEGVSEIADLCQDFEEMRQRLKETAEEKVEFDKESKELISNISHDLKTPITAVKGYVEGIMDGVANTPEKT